MKHPLNSYPIIFEEAIIMLSQKYHSFLTAFISCVFICFSQLVVADDNSYITLASPDNNTLNDLKLPSFRGLPVFSGSRFKLQPAEQRKMLQTASAYNSLLQMKFATTKPNAARLKENFDSSSILLRFKFDALGDNAWYSLLSQLASSTLTDQAYTQYGCKKDPCDRTELQWKGPNVTIKWGGSLANQFESRRAFGSFIDTELDKYLSWADSLDPQLEAYRIGITGLSPYIFEKGGFLIKIAARGGVLPTSGNLLEHPVFKNQVRSGRYSGILVKVNEAEAEKMIDRVQAAKKRLYFVYKTKFTIADKSYQPETKGPLHNLIFDQEFTSDVIEVFIGPELQDKLFDIPL